LLEEITRQQTNNAKHANPLTLLPGSVPINDQINQLLANKIPFSSATLILITKTLLMTFMATVRATILLKPWLIH
jgi:hypothetical protein